MVNLAFDRPFPIEKVTRNDHSSLFCASASDLLPIFESVLYRHGYSDYIYFGGVRVYDVVFRATLAVSHGNALFRSYALVKMT